jgi:hypothetical protein
VKISLCPDGATAVIVETRPIQLAKGEEEVRFDGFPPSLLPETLSFAFIIPADCPAWAKTVHCRKAGEEVEGGLVPYGTKSLVVLIESEFEGEALVEISYQVSQVSSSVTYNVTLGPEGAEVTGWLTVENGSGLPLEGQIQVVADSVDRRIIVPVMSSTVIAEGRTEIGLIFARDCRHVRKMVFVPDQLVRGVWEAAIIPNNRENGLGVALPGGMVNLSFAEGGWRHLLLQGTTAERAVGESLSVLIQPRPDLVEVEGEGSSITFHNLSSGAVEVEFTGRDGRTETVSLPGGARKQID